MRENTRREGGWEKKTRKKGDNVKSFAIWEEGPSEAVLGTSGVVVGESWEVGKKKKEEVVVGERAVSPLEAAWEVGGVGRRLAGNTEVRRTVLWVGRGPRFTTQTTIPMAPKSMVVVVETARYTLIV